jgi:uncharacterized membrane protein YsdA (DUF1294 family)
MFEAVALYLAGINLAAFCAFYADKRAAERREWRVRESTLLALALIGGSSGALVARQVLRHKTRKQPFSTYLCSIVAAQVAGLVAVWLQLALR